MSSWFNAKVNRDSRSKSTHPKDQGFNIHQDKQGIMNK